MILGFHTKQLTERGTEVALLDYAAGVRDELGHDVRIFVPAQAPVVDTVRRRVEGEFELILYDHPRSISCDALYVIKRGRPGRITPHVPELNHAFIDASDPHGERFAAVSAWVARTARWTVRLPRGRTVRVPKFPKPPVVPHIVSLPETADDLRARLGIPEEAVVFGRHGGIDTFSIDFVKSAVRKALDARPDLWFVFLNTESFHDHSRVVYLPLVADRNEIRKFLNTCDYMIHAYVYGETFGLAVAEFALVGAPVLTHFGMPRKAHFDLLKGDLLLGYRSEKDVFRYLTTLPRRREPVASDIRETYGVERVMQRFDEVFLR